MKTIEKGTQNGVDWKLINNGRSWNDGITSYVAVNYSDNQNAIVGKLWRIGDERWTGVWIRKDEGKKRPLKSKTFNDLISEFKSFLKHNDPKINSMKNDIRRQNNASSISNGNALKLFRQIAMQVDAEQRFGKQ